MLDKLNRRLRRVRHKLLRWATAMEVAEQRVKHHRRQRDHFQDLADRSHGEKREVYLRKRERAAKYLHSWQKRQTWIRNKIVFLQLVKDKTARKKHKWLQEHPDEFKDAPGPGEWVIFDGHEVPKWMAKINQKARDAGYWHGYVFSGRRSRQYSRELCEDMCGAPACPGRCAGEATNHCGPPSFEGVEYEGAEDVTDAEGLIRYCRDHNEPLRGAGEVLPADTPHCSHNGN